jgi:hypothetical protein
LRLAAAAAAAVLLLCMLQGAPAWLSKMPSAGHGAAPTPAAAAAAEVSANVQKATNHLDGASMLLYFKESNTKLRPSHPSTPSTDHHDNQENPPSHYPTATALPYLLLKLALQHGNPASSKQ